MDRGSNCPHALDPAPNPLWWGLAPLLVRRSSMRQGLKGLLEGLFFLEPKTAPTSGEEDGLKHSPWRHGGLPWVQRGPLERHRLQLDVLFPIHAVHPGGRSKSDWGGAGPKHPLLQSCPAESRPAPATPRAPHLVT